MQYYFQRFEVVETECLGSSGVSGCYKRRPIHHCKRSNFVGSLQDFEKVRETFWIDNVQRNVLENYTQIKLRLVKSCQV